MKAYLYFAAGLAVLATPAGAATITNEDFEAGATGWSDNRTEDPGTNSGGFSRHLGRFGQAQTSSKTFALTGTQTTVNVAFDWYRIDTWDGERFDATITDGVNSFTRSETGLFFDGGPANIYGSSFSDRKMPISFAFATTATSITLTFSSTLDQNFLDESWGVDNLVITDDRVVSAIPEPATWGMMIGGFGLAGASMRRRSTRLVVA